MFCMQCGKENGPNARFCEHCGASMSGRGQNLAGIGTVLQARTTGFFTSTAEPILLAVSFFVGLTGLVYWMLGALLWFLAQSAGIVGALDLPRELVRASGQAAASFMFTAVFSQVFGAFLLSCAYGLWNRRPWSRRLGLVLMIISAVVTFGSLGLYERVTGPIFLVTALSAVVDLLIIFWLVHPVTKEAFQGSA